eukprot:3790614-Amphidinium_carterae.1
MLEEQTTFRRLYGKPSAGFTNVANLLPLVIRLTYDLQKQTPKTRVSKNAQATFVIGTSVRSVPRLCYRRKA